MSSNDQTSLFVRCTCASALPVQSRRHAAAVDGYLIMHLKEPAAVFAPPHVKQGSYSRPSTGVFFVFFCGVTVDRLQSNPTIFDNGFLLVTPPPSSTPPPGWRIHTNLHLN